MFHQYFNTLIIQIRIILIYIRLFFFTNLCTTIFTNKNAVSAYQNEQYIFSFKPSFFTQVDGIATGENSESVEPILDSFAYICNESQRLFYMPFFVFLLIQFRVQTGVGQLYGIKQVSEKIRSFSLYY